MRMVHRPFKRIVVNLVYVCSVLALCHMGIIKVVDHVQVWLRDVYKGYQHYDKSRIITFGTGEIRDNQPRRSASTKFEATITPPVLQRAALFASWCLCLSPVGAFFGVLGYVQFVTMLVEIFRSIESMVHVLWRKHVWCLIFTYIEVVLQNQSRWGHGGMMQLRHGIH